MTSAGTPCNCITNNENFEYYFDSNEKSDLISEGYEIHNHEGAEYIITSFSYSKNDKEIIPTHVCQIPEDTAISHSAYSNLDGYYDNHLYFWSKDLKDGNMFAACDER